MIFQKDPFYNILVIIFIGLCQLQQLSSSTAVINPKNSSSEVKLEAYEKLQENDINTINLTYRNDKTNCFQKSGNTQQSQSNIGQHVYTGTKTRPQNTSTGKCVIPQRRVQPKAQINTVRKDTDQAKYPHIKPTKELIFENEDIKKLYRELDTNQTVRKEKPLINIELQAYKAPISFDASEKVGVLRLIHPEKEWKYKALFENVLQQCHDNTRCALTGQNKVTQHVDQLQIESCTLVEDIIQQPICDYLHSKEYLEGQHSRSANKNEHMANYTGVPLVDQIEMTRYVDQRQLKSYTLVDDIIRQAIYIYFYLKESLEERLDRLANESELMIINKIVGKICIAGISIKPELIVWRQSGATTNQSNPDIDICFNFYIPPYTSEDISCDTKPQQECLQFIEKEWYSLISKRKTMKTDQSQPEELNIKEIINIINRPNGFNTFLKVLRRFCLEKLNNGVTMGRINQFLSGFKINNFCFTCNTSRIMAIDHLKKSITKKNVTDAPVDRLNIEQCMRNIKQASSEMYCTWRDRRESADNIPEVILETDDMKPLESSSEADSGHDWINLDPEAYMDQPPISQGVGEETAISTELDLYIKAPNPSSIVGSDSNVDLGSPDSDPRLSLDY